MSDFATPAARSTWIAALVRGFKADLPTIALIAAINTGIAGVLWIDDTRAFWHPLVTVQIFGFVIAYCVNVAAPKDRRETISPVSPRVACCTCGRSLLREGRASRAAPES